MADPFRLRVLKNLSALIETTPLDGMQDENGNPVATLAGKVFRGREAFGENDPLPMVSILEPPLSIERIPSQADNTVSSGEWDILLQGWVVDDKDHPVDPAYVLSASVISVLAAHKKQGEGKRGPLGSNYLGEGLCVEKINIGAPVHRPADFPSANACFYLLVTLKITEDTLNPFG